MDLLNPPRSVGYGNAMFLADLAEHVPDREIDRRRKAKEYPGLHLPSVPGFRAMAGRSV